MDEIKSNESNEITLEDLKNYTDHGMRCDTVLNYQDDFKKINGRDLDPNKDMVLVGEYGDLVYDENGNWTKFILIGEDVGDGEFYFFLMDKYIYLEKGSLMLNEDYHEMFKSTISQFFGPDIENTVDFRGLK